MKKAFNVKMNNRAIKALTDAQIKAVKMTAEQMITEKIQQQEIPFDEGTLQNVQTRADDKEIRKGRVKIVHDTPYASRLYYNPQYNFSTDFNTNAKGEWWEDYITGRNSDKPSKLYKAFYKKCSGGFVQ